jgi:hypothetical protein
MTAKITKRPQVLKETQPALAVRGAGCLMCHAQVNSNIITDFGYGESYFLGNNMAGLSAPFYGNLGRRQVSGDPTSPWTLPWQSATISGKVLIPAVSLDPVAHATVRSSAAVPPSTSLSLAQLLSRSPYIAAYDPLPGTPVANISQPMIAAEKLEERSQIKIRAPSVSEIENLSIPASASVALVGFEDRGTYVLASGSVVCKGAHKITKPLMLDQVTINTDAGGCRLYSSRNVFVQGEIRYSGAGIGQHLQVSSARGIYMGFGTETLYARMLTGFMPWGYTRATPPLRLNTTDPFEAAADVGSFQTELYIDSLAVASHLVDAASVTPRPTVNFEHVVFNAPHWHSRYHGNVKGTIIAEIALGEVSNFSFEYDNLFDSETFELFPELASGSEGAVLEVGL